MRRSLLVAVLLGGLTATAAVADVAMVEHQVLHHNLHANKLQVRGLAKKPHVPTRATGSQGLIDASGLKFFINTNITFSTTSSASGAASEASYTHAVNADTMNGGTTSSTLNDAYDGYNTLCIAINNVITNCATGDANFVIYDKNGPATTECAGAISGVNRQVVLPVQTTGNLQMQRKVFVPDNDSFARWLNYFTNTGGTPLTVTAIIANNLGSDSNTKIVATSSGDTTVTAADTWVSSFQNWSGTTSSDVRLGHVLQSAAAPVPVAGISFTDGDDNPFWGYTFTLAPGETKIIMNFGVGQPTNAAAATKAALLASVPLPDTAQQCMTTAEKNEVANFTPPAAPVPTLGSVGLLGLGALLALAAVMILVKRRPAAI